MAEIKKEEMVMEEIDIKKEEIFVKEELSSSSSLEETCTWDVQEEDIQMENRELKGKDK